MKRLAKSQPNPPIDYTAVLLQEFAVNEAAQNQLPLVFAVHKTDIIALPADYPLLKQNLQNSPEHFLDPQLLVLLEYLQSLFSLFSMINDLQ